jgi:ribosome-associated heat shock protein Hsp15
LAAAPTPPDDGAIRLDKWLFHARFFKTRALAATLIERGRMRVNGQPTAKPGRQVRPGDVLTFAQGDRIRVIRVLAPGERRGPAPEARTLYADLDAPLDAPAASEPPSDDADPPETG